MNPETLNWANFGLGGVLAGVVFYFYRQAHHRLEQLQDQTLKALQENTKALTELRDAVTRLREVADLDRIMAGGNGR